MSFDIKTLLKEAARELDDDEAAKRTPEEKQLHHFCQRLLLLERDLRAPGSARTQDDRVSNILGELANAKL